MSVLFLALAGIAALGCGVAAAVYFNFSARVMPRLAGLETADGVRNMQGFNRQALRPPFMGAFFGAAAASVGILILLIISPASAALSWGAAGAGLYLISFVITVAYNVPRNEALDRVDPASPTSAEPWARYQRQWGGANTLRAWCAGAGTLALIASIPLGLPELGGILPA